MTVPFMRVYTERLVKICHKHGAHAMGGMSAFIPSRHDEEINKIAFSQVRGDKEREVADGFDGTWVAHPDLVQVSNGEVDDGEVDDGEVDDGEDDDGEDDDGEVDDGEVDDGEVDDGEVDDGGN